MSDSDKSPDDIEWERFMNEGEEEEPVFVPAKLPPSPKVVRTGRETWVTVDDNGIDPKTGEKPTPWVKPPEKRVYSATKAGSWTKRKSKRVSKKFVRSIVAVELDQPGNPESELWCEREPLACYLWARDAYVTSRHTIKEIVETTGWPDHRIRFWISISTKDRPAWIKDKKIEQNKHLREISKNTKEQCIQVIKNTLDVVDKAIAAIDDERAIEMSPKDISLLVGIAVELHKVSQLESGDPTNIIGRTKLTKESVLEKLKAVDIISYEPSPEGNPGDLKRH